MGAVARRIGRRASGTLALTVPMSAGGLVRAGWQRSGAGPVRGLGTRAGRAAAWALRLRGGWPRRRRVAGGRTWTARCAGGRRAAAGPDAGPVRFALCPAGGAASPAGASRRPGSAPAGTPAAPRVRGGKGTPARTGRRCRGGSAASAAASRVLPGPSGGRGGPCGPGRAAGPPGSGLAPAAPPRPPASCPAGGAAGPGSRTGRRAHAPSRPSRAPPAASRRGHGRCRRRPSRTARLRSPPRLPSPCRVRSWRRTPRLRGPAPAPAASCPGTMLPAGRAGSRRGRARGGHIRAEHHALAVLDLAGGPGMLAGDSGRHPPFLQLAPQPGTARYEGRSGHLPIVMRHSTRSFRWPSPCPAHGPGHPMITQALDHEPEL